MDIDIVIPFVDCADVSWQEEYQKIVGTPYNPVRYRSWDTVKYILRGVENFMSWVHNVFLVVMSETQIPDYIDTQRVKIVYHRDFMPEDQLPCFNSNPIEAYIWNIPGLSEHFIYFNDDMLPTMRSYPNDFFKGSSIVRCTQIIKNRPEILNIFHHIRENCSILAYKAVGKPQKGNVIFQRHGPQGMLRSECQKCYEAVEKDIKEGLTPVRSSSNICQYIYTDYLFLKNKTDKSEKPASLMYIDFKKFNIDQVVSLIINPQEKFMCINDNSDVGDHFEEYRQRVITALNILLPNKSSFEK